MLYLYTLLLLPLLVLFALVLYDTAAQALSDYMLYRWLALGVALYTVARLFVRKNIAWVECFAHEMTHIVVAALFLRDIREMNVTGRGTGRAVTAGTSLATIPLTLAPYCLPLFTYLMLALRPLISSDANSEMVYDTLTGLTLGLHLHVFALQTRTYQTDITRFPLPFSFVYILTFLAFNLSTVLYAFQPGENIFTALWHVVKAAALTLIHYI